MVKTLSVLAIAIVLVSFGDMLLAQGMKKIGAVPAALLGPFPSGPADFFQSLHHHRYYLPGRLLLSLAGRPILVRTQFLSCLSLALSYVLTAFLSIYFLGETITPLRWAGTILICVGVALVTKSGV